jgi:hypothetical protein
MRERLVGFRKLVLGGSIALAAVAGAPREAHATLGGVAASVDANRKNLGGVLRIERLAYGERHVLVLPTGMVIRQYLSPSGAVYAVSWHGHRMPNVQEILGSYAEQLSHRDRIKGGRHNMRLTGTDFMMSATGHGQTFSGRAWVPSLVPAGVDLDSILRSTEAL